MAGFLFFRVDLFLDHILCGDRGMVHARKPQGAHAPHAGIARHQVFDGQKHRMAYVERSRHVGRRHGDRERFGAFPREIIRVEEARRLPLLIGAFFVLVFVCFW